MYYFITNCIIYSERELYFNAFSADLSNTVNNGLWLYVNKYLEFGDMISILVFKGWYG